MAMHWRTLLHCALIVLASFGLADPVAIAPAQQPGSGVQLAGGPPPQQHVFATQTAGYVQGASPEDSTILLAAALSNPPSDRAIAPGTLAPGTFQPELLPPGAYQQLSPPADVMAPAVPLGDPTQTVDNLPAIMVPQSPFLPLVTQPEPVNWLPVLSEPWSQRPMAAGMFTGILWGDLSMDRHVRLDSGLIYGGRFGWDFNDHWAWEGRVAIATLSVDYPGTELASTTSDAILWDLQLHMSLFTRPRLKTYVALGAGMGFFDLVDHHHEAMTETLVTVPIGLGMKYRHDDWLVFRLDFADNLSLGKRSSGLSSIHNFSLVGGLELRFGGYQRDYWPWSLR